MSKQKIFLLKIIIKLFYKYDIVRDRKNIKVKKWLI